VQHDEQQLLIVGGLDLSRSTQPHQARTVRTMSTWEAQVRSRDIEMGRDRKKDENKGRLSDVCPPVQERVEFPIFGPGDSMYL
jgi:hypothetical protein